MASSRRRGDELAERADLVRGVDLDHALRLERDCE